MVYYEIPINLLAKSPYMSDQVLIFKIETGCDR